MCSYKYWEIQTKNGFSFNYTAAAQQAHTFDKNEQRQIMYMGASVSGNFTNEACNEWVQQNSSNTRVQLKK